MTFMDQNNPFSFIFGAKPGAGVPTYEQLQMRRKIAESLLGQKTRYPKTFGEGLSAIGEAIGERGMMNRLEEMEQAKAAQDKVLYDDATTGAAPPPAYPAAPSARPMSYAPANTAPIPGTAGTPTPVEDGGYNALDQLSSVPPAGSPWAARSAAIAGIESGGNKDPYSLRGALTKGDRALGKYQVMGRNVPEWTRAALGQPMTPQAFLASPEAQEAVFKHRFGGYVDKYGEEGAAKAWYGGEKGMNNPNATDIHGRLTVRGYGQDYLKRLGPQSSVIDPGLNQSVALDQTEPPAPVGPPTAFSGQPVSDAPPIGVPDARDAITSALAPKPPPVIPSPIPALPPAGPQIAQAPPQPQIRVPEREPVPPPPPQATERMRKIEKALSTIGDPMQREVLAKRYQQEALEQKAIYDQRFEEYKHKRNRWETAPERALAAQKAQQEAIKAEQEASELKRTGGLGSKALLEPVVESQKKVATLPATTQALNSARASVEQGMFTGMGANQKLAIAKSKAALAGMLGIDASDPRIENTETFKATIMPLVAQARSATAGNANISDADIKLALQAAGGDITLDVKTFPKVLDALERINVGLAIGHQGRVTAAAAGDERAAQALQGVYGLPMEEIVPARIKQHLKEHPETAAEFDKTFKTPGLARKILTGQ